MRRILPLLAATTLLGPPGVAVSEAAAGASERLDAGVRSALQAVLVNMEKLDCGTGPCSAATPDELRNPPIPLDQARVVFVRGMTSGFAEGCGLDWKTRNFLPLMQYWRKELGTDERRMAMIGALHGVGQQAGRSVTPSPCPEHVRQAVERQLAFDPRS